MASSVEFTGYRRRFRLGYKPTCADVRRIALEKRGRYMGQPQGLQVKGVPLCHIDKSFVYVGWMCEG